MPLFASNAEGAQWGHRDADQELSGGNLGCFSLVFTPFQLTDQSYALEIEPSGSGDIERTRYGTYRILFRMQIARYKEPAHKEAQLPVKDTRRSSRTNKE